MLQHITLTAAATCIDSCVYAGCTDSIATNYNAMATIEDSSCAYGGCMDALACNFSSTATVDDGSCDYGATPSLENFDLGIGTWINAGWITKMQVVLLLLDLGYRSNLMI